MKLPADMTAEDVVADILAYLYEEVLKKLTKTFGADTVKVTPINFWLTVPASWQEEANSATRSAALRAGFGSRRGDNLSMITEPEAAAMAILSKDVERNPGLYKVGTNILVADLGGGTIDFQCLQIKIIEPLTTKEPCEGDAGKAGSIYIDFAFHRWLEQNFRETFKELPVSKVGIGSDFMEDWEIAKKTFNGKDLQKTYRLRLPALGKALNSKKISPTCYDFDEWSVLLTGAEMKELFQPIVEKALALVKEQLGLLKKHKELPFRAIVLCGGLGTSEYVWTVFQEFCAEELGNAVKLLVDDRAWSAVVRGAAVRGLEGSMVLAKKAKRCYGIGVHQSFREGIDDENMSFICPVGGKRAPGYIDWTVKKRKRFTPGMREVSNVYVALDDGDEDLTFKWDLYSCGRDNAPVHWDIQHEGKIRLDLTKFFGKTYKRAMKAKAATAGSAASGDQIRIRIVIKLGNVSGVLEVEAVQGRKVVGTATIDFSKTHARKGHQSAGKM